MKWLNLPLVKSFVERAIRHYDGRKMMISFTGGEPTLWPEFGEFVEWLSSKNVLIGMTTNGTKPGDFFKTHSRYFDWINFSYHPEFTRTPRFLENVAAASKTTAVCIRVMMPPETELWKVSEAFISEAIRWDLEKKFTSQVRFQRVPIALGFGSEHTHPASYSVEQHSVLASPMLAMKSVDVEILSKSPLSRLGQSSLANPTSVAPFDTGQLIAENQTDFHGWTCDIGLEQIFVDHNGVISRAGCRVGGNIGHIAESTIQFPTRAVRCIKTYCHCVTDILTSKRSEEWEAQAGGPPSGFLENLNFALEIFKYKLIGNIREWKTEEFNFRILTGEANGEGAIKATAYKLVGVSTLILGRLIGLIGAIHLAIVRVIWSRPIRKPYYFARYQFYKRILRKEAPPLVDKWTMYNKPRP